DLRAVHALGCAVAQLPPAQVLLAGQEHRILDGAAGHARLPLGEHLQIVEPADEQQVGDLLDHLDRIADAAGPEGVPDAVDPALQLTSDHTRHCRRDAGGPPRESAPTSEPTTATR